MPRELAGEAEHGDARRELHLVGDTVLDATERHRLLPLDRPEPEARRQLDDGVRQALADAHELAPAELVDVAVGVHQPLQQRQPLVLGRAQVAAAERACSTADAIRRSMLVSEASERVST